MDPKFSKEEILTIAIEQRWKTGIVLTTAMKSTIQIVLRIRSHVSQSRITQNFETHFCFHRNTPPVPWRSSPKFFCFSQSYRFAFQILLSFPLPFTLFLQPISDIQALHLRRSPLILFSLPKTVDATVFSILENHSVRSRPSPFESWDGELPIAIHTRIVSRYFRFDQKANPTL